jgi:hypothetical protein
MEAITSIGSIVEIAWSTCVSLPVVIWVVTIHEVNQFVGLPPLDNEEFVS